MSLEWYYRPIERWPRELDGNRIRSPFKADWNNTFRILRHEVQALGANEMVLQLAVREQDIRQDGNLRQDARFAHPGAIVAFKSKYGPLQLPCDWFVDWRHNVRAIALHLEHLRLAGLYGVGRWGEQYRGWKALPDANAITPAMTAEQAAQFVFTHAPQWPAARFLDTPATFAAAYRLAAKKLHPDAGGTVEQWNALQEAARVLKNVHEPPPRA